MVARAVLVRVGRVLVADRGEGLVLVRAPSGAGQAVAAAEDDMTTVHLVCLVLAAVLCLALGIRELWK
jgi:hypothetical protein